MKVCNAVIENAKNRIQRIASLLLANPWMERLFRLGYAAKGVVYAIIGWLAATAAYGAGGKTTNARGSREGIA